jgi:PPIC-type PPIASE domain
MNRFLKEPLVHFLALGALLFAIGLIRGEPDSPAGTRIAITEGHINRLLEGFRMTWSRPPTESEFQGLVEEMLKEEVLYREALGMGLDQDDQIIRRRLRQKLEFMTADFVGSIEPTEEDLTDYLNSNVDRYRQEGSVTFVQVFIQAETLADETRAEEVLQSLRADPGQDASTLSDPFLHPAAYTDISERGLSGIFGPDFAALMMSQPLGEWSGPIPSPFGLHVVRVDARNDGRPSELAEVRNEVYRDLVFERTNAAEEAYFQGLLTQYTVTVDWPEGMDPVELPGVVR